MSSDKTSEHSTVEAPAGFHLLPKDGGFNDAISPIFMKVSNDGFELALKVDQQHCNLLKICHGGVYMTMMDILLSASICYQLGKFMGIPTININLNYMASSKQDEWIYGRAKTYKTTKTMGFAEGEIYNDDGIKVSAQGIFKLPKDLEQTPGMTLEQVIAMYPAE